MSDDCTENFIPNAQVERHFKLAAPLPESLWLDNWPADLPLDFDAQMLDLMKLPHCCVLKDVRRGGFVIVPLRDHPGVVEREPLREKMQRMQAQYDRQIAAGMPPPPGWTARFGPHSEAP
jgi:hypothetical protein